jgi:N-acyl-phosphatidylethanolamine-hydrolysing phospholipase D
MDIIWTVIITKKFQSLWSGWLIKGSKHSFYFTGDTGFCEDEFRKIGNKFGPVDLCAIPIGCYSPRLFLNIP